MAEVHGGSLMYIDRLDLEQACEALVSLVREEYPTHLSLAEIAYTWGFGITDKQIEALRRLDAADA